MSAANPFFTRHAGAYAVSAGHARGADLARLVELLTPQPGQRAIDVATGTGHTAVALADAGLEVVGLDPTPAMLAEARALARGRATFLEGVAERLPFPDRWADVITCRRAAHHFTDIGAALAEAARVLRPGGRLGISDLVPPAEAAEAANHLERLRDPTHMRALTEAEWPAAVEEAGLRLVAAETMIEDVTFETWLSPVAPGGSEAVAVRAALAALTPAARAAITGGRDGLWRKRRLVLVAARPDAGAPGSGPRGGAVRRPRTG